MPGPRLDGLVVLLVEDDEDLRALMALALEARGATVEGAGDANEARRKLRAGRPGIIVCDIGLPGEDGCSMLRSLPESSEIPAIALTGRPDSEVARAGYRMQLSKPVELNALVEAIASVLGPQSG